MNALWDAAPLVGDRVAVVGAGMVGCCVARLLARMPGVRVTLVDVDPARAGVAGGAGGRLRPPEDAADGRDLVVHTSATSAGLQQSLDLLAPEGTVLDLSWYGDAAGHARRSAARSTPVGSRSAPARSAPSPRPGARDARTADRLALALDLLRDPAFDALLTGDVPLRRAAGRDAPAGRPGACPRSATRSPTTRA